MTRRGGAAPPSLTCTISLAAPLHVPRTRAASRLKIQLKLAGSVRIGRDSQDSPSWNRVAFDAISILELISEIPTMEIKFAGNREVRCDGRPW